MNTLPTDPTSWRALGKIRVDGLPSLRNLFAADPARGDRLGTECADLWIDPSRQHINDDVLGALTDLATERDVVGFLRRTADGGTVNSTEGRAASHGDLRLPRTEAPADVIATRDRMAELASAIRAGEATGATGAPIRAVVNLGIGGSHLGPALVTDALGHLAHPDVTVRFSSGVDVTNLAEALRGLDPASTLVVACSKSFTTVETLTALDGTMAWLADGIGDSAVDHVVAVTAAADRARALGIYDDHILDLPESVGGRFSVSSAVGLSAMVAVGPDGFEELLAGMHAVDVQATSASGHDNAAILLALIDVWNRSVLDRGSLAVVPYAHGLRLLPSHLQQLSMESLGKRVADDGSLIHLPTGPVVWGATGTDAQHAFFQLLHQGTDVIPVDFIGVARPVPGALGGDERARRGADLLMANLAAQADALAFGRTADEVRGDGGNEELVAHRTLPGNRPSTAILLPELTPSTLGQLIALYENRTIATAAVLGINPFDQWGVELGKQMALALADGSADGSGLLRKTRALRDD